jgi:hypothetical protein
MVITDVKLTDGKTAQSLINECDTQYGQDPPQWFVQPGLDWNAMMLLGLFLITLIVWIAAERGERIV